MTILLVLLCLIFIMVVLRLIINTKQTIELFQNKTFIATSEIDPKLIQAYKKFTLFFNEFQTNWQKAIVTSIVSDIPQQPLTSPSQISSSQAPVQPSISEINVYIQKLSKNEGIEFPQILTTMPTEITHQNITLIEQQIPVDSMPYKNALKWMNSQLSKVQENMDKALRGESITEGFYQDMCSDITKCIQNNPALIAQISKASSENTEQMAREQQAKLLERINKFINDNILKKQLELNQQLIKKSQDIQNQAQSGELINKINIAGTQSEIKYTMPPGASALQKIRETNPTRYNELKTNFSDWVSLKEMLEQINRNL